jgi:hypothetical protein
MGSDMKTTEEIIELNEKWKAEPLTIEDAEVLALHGDVGFLGGYRTAEAESQQAIRELVAELEEARDDVEHCLNMDMLKRPANKPAIEAGESQLARIDALIAKYKE